MLLLHRPTRTALHLPVFFVLFTAVICAASGYGLVTAPHLGTGLGALVSLLLFGLAVGDIRWIRARDGRLDCRMPFGRKSVDLSRCAFGVEVRYGHRSGPTYVVYATDGEARMDISDHFGVRGADRVAGRMKAFLDESSRREPAQMRVDRERAAWEAAQASARAQVEAYYRSKGWRRMGWFILAGLVLYLAAMGLYIAMQ